MTATTKTRRESNAARLRRQVAAMTDEQLITFAREQQQIRNQRGAAQAESNYNLVCINPRNPHTPESWGVQNLDGTIWVIRGGSTYDYATGEKCPDQYNVDAINDELMRRGYVLTHVRTKHYEIRLSLWLALPDDMDADSPMVPACYTCNDLMRVPLPDGGDQPCPACCPGAETREEGAY